MTGCSGSPEPVGCRNEISRCGLVFVEESAEEVASLDVRRVHTKGFPRAEDLLCWCRWGPEFKSAVWTLGSRGIHPKRRHERSGRMTEAVEPKPVETFVLLSGMVDRREPDTLAKTTPRPGLARHRWKEEPRPVGPHKERRR